MRPVERERKMLKAGLLDRPRGRKAQSEGGARRFIAAAKELQPQPAAFYTLALDSGARKGELCGLKWTDIDLDAGTVAIVRQLIKPSPQSVFGPLKNGESRTISIAPETTPVVV
jgi:integrase